MRDKETGSVTPAAHLIGFFRRLCKLRFHGIRPIFVFDGATPEIKLRELRERRKRREQFGGGNEDSAQRMAKRILAKQLLKKEGGKFTIVGSWNDVGREKEMSDGDKESIKDASRNEKMQIPNSSFAPGFYDPSMETQETTSKGKSQDIIELLDDDDYLEEDIHVDRQSDWDTVVIEDNSTGEGAEEKRSSSKRPFENANQVDFDIDHVASLSSSQRKDMVEKAQRKRRMLSRREFMKVAYDTSSFSHCQLKNFLQSSQLNKDIQTMAKKAVKHEGKSQNCAADGTKRIIFEKDSEKKTKKKSKQELLKEYRKRNLSILASDNEDSDDDDDDIQWESASDQDENKVNFSMSKTKAIIDDDSSSDEDDESSGFLREEPVTTRQNTVGFFTSDGHSYKIDRGLDNEKTNELIEIDDVESPGEEQEYRDRKIAQELQDENLATAMQNAEFLEDETGGGFLSNQEVTISAELPIEEMRKGSPDKAAHTTQSEKLESSDDDDEVDWEDGNDDHEQLVDTVKGEVDGSLVSQSPKPAPNESRNTSGTDTSQSIVDLTKLKEEKVEESESDLDWEDGDEPLPDPSSDILEKESQYSIKEVGLKDASEADFEEEAQNVDDGYDVMGGSDSWSNNFGKNSATSTEVTEALDHAQATASNLTNWAGRAFRRAVAQHAMETGTVLPEAAKPKAVTLKDGTTATNEIDNIKSKSNEGSSEVLTKSVARDANKKAMKSMENLEEEFMSDFSHQARDMGTVTDEMRAECMHLLDLFGVPYVESPAEAEAQCVELERLGLVDGIVTEDSDAFVFGGQMIYKNIFEEKKYVEIYNAADAKKEMNLTREGLVGLAMLMGGDYTEGIRGVGIVNGMEIIEAFNVSEGLTEGLSNFRKWLDGFVPPEENKGTKEQLFHQKHRTAKNRWAAPKHFPDPRVLTAYLNPVVDSSRKPFSWGVPDFDGLLNFCRRNVGWTTEETSALLNPVLKRLQESGSTRQTRIDSFMRYEDGIKFADIRSKRLRDVLSAIQKTETGKNGSEFSRKRHRTSSSISRQGTKGKNNQGQVFAAAEKGPTESVESMGESQTRLNPSSHVSRATNIKTADLVEKILPKDDAVQKESAQPSKMVPKNGKGKPSNKAPPAYQRHSLVAVAIQKEGQGKKFEQSHADYEECPPEAEY